MKVLLHLTLLLVFSTNIFAQTDEFCYVDIQLEAAQRKTLFARYYKEARAKIKVELIEYSFENGKMDFGKIYKAQYLKEKDSWQARVPQGWYLLRSRHIGFQSVQEIFEFKKIKEKCTAKLKIEGELPYTYEDGSTYTYVKGTMQFSETIIVFFKGGTPEENHAYLEENFDVENVQKMSHTNAFFLTLNLKNQESLPEILIRQAMGDKALNEGFYFGAAITKNIEKLLNNPNVDYANPSFVVPRSSVVELNKKEYGHTNSILTEFEKRDHEHPKFLNVNDYKKSPTLKRKLLKQLEE